MDLGLTGKRAIVTGASRGIGLAVARILVEEGVHVVAASRETSPELKDLVASGWVEELEADLSTAAGPDHIVATALERGNVDILINNAGGVTPRLEGSGGVTDDQWWSTLTLVLMAAVRTTRAVLPHMLSSGHGAIVNTASVNAWLPDPVVIDYSAAKAALVNYSKAVSKEVGPHGIRINTVSPGPVATDLWLGDHGVGATLAGARGGTPSDFERGAVQDAATGRFTTPREVADLIVFLISDRAGNVTGVDYVIDGGLIQTL
jgi:NAD(P)-dependent dehydrogenase (short-subunit alcohol dehydrogenase family)